MSLRTKLLIAYCLLMAALGAALVLLILKGLSECGTC